MKLYANCIEFESGESGVITTNVRSWCLSVHCLLMLHARNDFSLETMYVDWCRPNSPAHQDCTRRLRPCPPLVNPKFAYFGRNFLIGHSIFRREKPFADEEQSC